MRDASTHGYIARGTSLEPESADLGIDSTPVEQFFVCKVATVPTIDVADWTLHVTGDAVTNSGSLDYATLQRLPQHRVDSWLECAGNGRMMFELVGGGEFSSGSAETPWMLGAMGMASWEGPTLPSVLEIVGVTADASWVSPAGLDVPNREGEPVRMCLPIEKALHPDTIIALRMNGEPLQPAHGFPARLLVPGWIGAYSVKWLDRIEVSADWIPSWRADDYYRLRTPEGADLGPATAHPVKSSLALPWPATLEPGGNEIRGYARAAGVPIKQVEWSVDGGPWQAAELTGPNGDWTWSPFRFEWEAAPGEHILRCRASDVLGNTQPETMPFHPDGILWHSIIPHPVTVIAAR